MLLIFFLPESVDPNSPGGVNLVALL